MFGVNDPYQVVAGLGIVLLLFVGMWQLIDWVRESPVKPDPWDAEVEQKLSEPGTPEICPHCSTPQLPTARFCEHCGRAIGYNNVMPFLNVSEGKFRSQPLVVVGYVLLSVTVCSYFAPVFWFFLLSNVSRRRTGEQES